MKMRVGKGRTALKILAAVLLIGIIIEGVLMLSVYIAGARDWPESDTDVAIVLGARVMPSGELSTTLLHRVQRALQLYEDGYVKAIIVCGAKGSDEPMTEADAMAEHLINMGVPATSVFKDADSFDTIQNVRNAMAIMAREGFETATLVTSEYHLTRALWIANDQGLTAKGAPAKGPNTRIKQLEANIRETLSWINYWSGGLLGRISGLGSYGE